MTRAHLEPLLLLLVALMMLDVVMGLLVAFTTKELNSTVSWLGMSRKIGTLLIVVICEMIGPYIPGVDIGGLASLFYCCTETISALENAGKLGIPLPQQLVDSLAKVRGQSAPTLPKE